MEPREFDFDTQLKLGKIGEKMVMRHLQEKEETIDVKDLSNNPDFQFLGIDFLWVRENKSTGIIMGTFVDIKTDFLTHSSGKLFIETNSTAEKEGCMITSKAEYFLIYDPILGKLYYLPIYALRQRYYGKGHSKAGWISKNHFTIKNPTYESEGFTVTLDELAENIPNILVEDIDPIPDNL